MSLTQEQIRIMDQIAGLTPSPEDKNITLTDEQIKEMDRISGLESVNITENQDETEPDLRTQIINEDRELAQKWLDKGVIKPFEYVQKTAKYFNGSYDNIDNSVNFGRFDNWIKSKAENFYGKSITERSKEVDERIAREKQEKLERNKRVNEGTASFSDKVGAALDSFGQESYNSQKNNVDINERKENIDRKDKMKRYKDIGVDPRTGMPIYKEINLLEKIGFLEAAGNAYVKAAVGQFSEPFDKKKEREIFKKIYNNEPIRQDELDFVNRRVNEEREKIVRGYSLSGQIGAALGASAGITANIIAGGALFKVLGGAALAANLGTKTTTALGGVKGIAKFAPSAGKITEWGVNILGGAAVATAINPFTTAEEYQSRMLNNEMQITDTGIKIFAQSEEKPATAFFKSLAKTYIMYGVEMGGGEALSAVAKNTTGAIGKYGVSPVMNKLFDKYPKLEKLLNQTTIEFSKKYEKLNNLPVIGKSTGWMKDNAHFDGFLEEMGEEALEDVLNRLVGTNNEERSLEGYAKDIFKTPEEWLVIAGCIAIQGGGMSILNKGMSAADFVLGTSMAKRGVEPEKIQDVLEDASQEQKSQLIDELVKKDDLTLNIDNPEYNKRQELHRNFINEIKKGVENKNTSDEITEEAIDDIATIMSESVANLANNIGMDVDKVNQKFKFKIQTLTDEQAISQVKADEQKLLNAESQKPQVLNQDILNNKQMQFSQDKYEINEEQKKLYNQYSLIIDKVFDKKKHFTENISLGVTPQALIDCGLSNIPLETSPKVIQKMKTKNRHNVKTRTLKALPYLINNPIAVFKSNNNNSNNVIVLLNAKDKNNLPVMLSIDKNNKKGVNEVNFITSGYGRKENFFKTLINNNKLIKIQNKNIPDWLQEFINSSTDSVSVNHNSVNTDTIKNTNTSISNFENNLNPSVTKYEENNNILFQSIEEQEQKSNKKLDNKALEINKKYTVKSDNKTQVLTFKGFGENKANQKTKQILFFADKYNREIKLLSSEIETFEIPTDKSEFYKGSIDELLEIDNLFNKELTEGREYAVFEHHSKGKTEKHIWQYVKKEIHYKGSFPENVLIFRNKSGKLVEVHSDKYIYNADTKIEEDVKEYWEHYQKEQEQDYNEQTTEEGIKNSRGFTYQTTNFDGTEKEHMIVLLGKKADKSTLLHEFAHIYLNVLNELASENKQAKAMLLKINKQLRYDGKEYTKAQLEKFAQMFEAYVKTGKSPTYAMKKAFEHFRKWLGDIYNSISSNGKYEISKEWQNIFDELLGDKSVDVQVKQMNELLEKARNYANLKKFQSQKDEIVGQNYLTGKQIRYRDTAYEIIFYALKHSKNEETRNYVQTIEQLKMILGAKSTKKDAKGLARQRERLELVLAETEDAFSANDGFLPQWGEFFNDPGVSYNNMKQGSDAQLAMNAYYVIVDKTYLRNEDNHAEVTDNDVNFWQDELNYIIEEYKKESDENKTLATCAFNQWIDSIHPYAQDAFLSQWETKTNEIDRYQKLDKWQRAKDDLKLEAAKLKMQGDTHWQFMDYVRKILKRLDFITEADKIKLFNKLKEYDTMRDIERNLDDIFDFAQTLYEVSQRRHLSDDIQREVKSTIHEWQNGIKKTKYTYPANKLFTRLREINRMKEEEIQMLYDAQVNDEIPINYTNEDLKPVDFYEQMERDFIKFKYNGSQYNSIEFLTDLLQRIQTAKFEAMLARDEIDFNRRVEKINLIDKCAEAANIRKKQLNEGSKKYLKLLKAVSKINAWGANFNGYLSMLFGDKIKAAFSLDYLYAKKDAQVGKDRRIFIDEAKKIYGFKKGKLGDIQFFNMLIDMNKADEFEIKQRFTPDVVNGVFREWDQDKESGKTYTVKEIQLRKEDDNYHSEWEDETVKLSRLQVLYYYIQSKNDQSYKMLTDMGDENTPPKGQFDKSEFNEMINKLTPQEKLLGDLMQICAEKYWEKLNAYHIKKYHTELGKVKNYFPRLSETEDVKILDLFNDYVQFSAVGKFQKIRTAGPGVRIKAANPLAVLFDHMERANTIIIMGEQLDLMNRVLKDTNLKNKLQNIWGEQITTDFYNELTAHLFTGQSICLSLAEKWQNRIASNLTKVQIMGKLIMIPKQFLSFMNYGKGDEYVSAKEWGVEFLKQMAHPEQWKSNIDYMMNIPYLKDRFSRGGSTDALKRELETKMFAKINLLDDIWTLPVSIGDIGAIIAGGKPYIDCLIKKGYSEQEAIKIFIETTVNDQQSSIPSTLNQAQRNAAKSPMARMFYAFQNTPWQYWRHCSNAVFDVLINRDKKSALNAMNKLFFYAYLFPMLFNMVSSGSLLRYILTGDSDDLLNDLNPLFVIPSVFYHIPYLGNTIKAIIEAIKGERITGDLMFEKNLRELHKLIDHWKKEELTIKDMYEAANALQEPIIGAPTRPIENSLSGVGDILTGKPLKGSLKAIGMTDYRAKHITGEE